MKWRIAACLLILGSLLGVFIPIVNQSPPVDAFTLYGCGTYPGDYLGDPIGGGLGYSEIFTSADARHNGIYDASFVVSTATELKTALAHATHSTVIPGNDRIYIEDNATCTIDGGNSNTYYLLNGTRYMVYVPVGVWLVGGRGGVGVTPGKITLDGGSDLISWETWRQCVVMNTNSRVMGLDIDGTSYTTTQTDVNDGVYMRGDNCEVANNIIKGWGHAGIRHWSGGGAGVTGGRAHHNYITYCQVNGYGYGIATEGYGTAATYPEFDGNYIDFSRHHFSGNGGTAGSAYTYSSYNFHHNYLGANCTHTNLDQHGGTDHLYAGGTWTMHHNTCLDSGAFVGVRGTPFTLGSVYYNWTYADPAAWFGGVGGSGDPKVRAINEQLYTSPGYGFQCPEQNISGVITAHDFVNMDVYNNWYLSDTPPYGTTTHEVRTTAPSDVIGDTARLSGSITADNFVTSWVINTGFVWDTVSHANPDNTTPSLSAYAYSFTDTDNHTDNATLYHIIDGLTEGETYYARFGTDWYPPGDWEYGEEVVFTTPDTGCVVRENITVGWDGHSEIIGSDNQSFQSILATDNEDVNYVYLRTYRIGAPTILHAYLFNENTTTFVPEGAHLAEGSYDVSAITTDNMGEWIIIPLDATVSMVAGLYYDLVVTQDEPQPNSVVWNTTSTVGTDWYAYSTDNGVNWVYPADGRDAMFSLRECAPLAVGAATGLHIVSIQADKITLSWQETTDTSIYYRMVYKTTGYPTSALDPLATLVSDDIITSTIATDLSPGTTYYFGVWGHIGPIYSIDGAFVAATTSAGHALPATGVDAGGEEDPTILGSSPIGGLIDFVSDYAGMPDGTVGLLGFGSIFMFALVGLACYNRSVLMVTGCAIAGLALGSTLGILSFVFLAIAVIIGVGIGYLRGGQPTGG